MRFLAIFLLAFLPLIQAMTVEELEEKLTSQLEVQRKHFDLEILEMKAELQENLGGRVRKLEELMARTTGVHLNDTEELEARVTALEESMEEVEEDVVVLQTSLVTLADEVDDVEADNSLQDQRLNTMEMAVLDNENDIEVIVSEVDVLEDTTISLGNQVTVLDQRVTILESGGGGGTNNTELEERVETLEEVTSQLTNDVSSLEDNDVTQDERISSIEEDVTSLDQRVGDLESGGGGGGNGTAFRDTIFMVALDSEMDGAANPLIFERYVINLGDHYSNETGKYTVPYDGIYQFFANIQYSSGFVRIDVYVDDTWQDTHNDQFSESSQYYRSFTFLQELTAGQTVHVVVDASGSGAYGRDDSLITYFGGYMIMAN